MYNEILNELLGDLSTVVSRNYVYGKIKDRTGWFFCDAIKSIKNVGVDAAIRTQSSRVAGCVEASKME